MVEKRFNTKKWKKLLREVDTDTLHHIEDSPNTHPKVFRLALIEDKRRNAVRFQELESR